MTQHQIIASDGDPLETRRRLAGDPHRPVYHFLPPDGQMQDIDAAIYWRGTYHMFYLQHRQFPGGPAWWGHASSTDMVHWQDLPYALAPDQDYDKHGIWSGKAVDNQGVPTIVYTGKRHPGTFRTDPDQYPEVQCVATSSDDLLTWTKHPANPVIVGAPGNLKLTGFRDPCAWREQDGLHMLVGSGVEGVGGTMLHYRSQDLAHWEYLGPLLTGSKAETGWMWEVPDFFPLNDKWVLTFVPILDDAAFAQRQAYYIGRYEDHRFTPERFGLLDTSRFYLAASTFAGPSGRRIAYAWLLEGRSMAPRIESGWSSIAALPRELTLDDDGSLSVAPVRELEVLRGAHRRMTDVTLHPDEPALPFEIAGKSLEIAVELDSGDADAVELRVLCSPDGEEATTIKYDWSLGQLSLDTTRSSLNNDGSLWTCNQIADVWSHGDSAPPITEQPSRLRAGEQLILRVFVDHSVVEVFLNNRACITGRMYPTRHDSTGVSVTACGGRCRLLQADVWEMASIW